MFAIAAETGWSEERILFMPLARLTQYQHCLWRRNGVRTHRVNPTGRHVPLHEQFAALRAQWAATVDADFES